MNLVSLDYKDTRERRVTRDCQGKSELKDYQAQVDQEASWEYWAPKGTGDLVGNLVI